jgi:GLPGLI family protein
MRRIIALLAMTMSFGLHAQYMDSCTITFEKTMYIQNMMKDNEWMKKYASNIPAENKEIFYLVLRPHASEYFPENTNDIRVPGLWGYALNKNQISTNLKDSIYAENKDIYDKKVRVLDTIRNLSWTITNTYRNIAGYNCRQATTVIFDSVKVFAFYCPQIKPSAGPDAFNGLPGCILGVALPALHLNWFATKVSANLKVLPKNYMLEKKREQYTNASLVELLSSKSSQMPAKYRRKSYYINAMMILL